MIEGKETVYTEIRDNLEYIGTQLNIFVELYRKVHEEEIQKSEDPDYIEILGQAIAKEGRKDPMDFSYILEKTGKIERFIRDVTEDMRRQEEDEIEEVDE